MLKIDSIEFIVCALLLVVAMRGLSAARARALYALLSMGVYLALLPGWPSVALALGFIFWPFFVLRAGRPLPPAMVPLTCWVQTILLVWSRKYLTVFPELSDVPLLAHGLAIVAVSYIILRQVELILWVDANPEVRVGLLEYIAFTVGLYTLLAGPVIPYRDFQRDFVSDIQEDPRSMTRALNRIVNGYIKVSLLSPLVYDLSSLETLERMGMSSLASAAFFYLYPWYVYLNFAGYCDVVIGLGRLSRFPIPENFDRPFLAVNIQNYWQRWHITFSNWIRVHIFFPFVRAFRGSRLAALRAAAMPLSLFLTFIVVGVWHGTDPGFAVFGVLHGIAVLAVAPWGALLVRLFGEQGLAAYERSRALRVVRVAACYHYLCFTMTFFERPLSDIIRVFG